MPINDIPLTSGTARSSPTVGFGVWQVPDRGGGRPPSCRRSRPATATSTRQAVDNEAGVGRPSPRPTSPATHLARRRSGRASSREGTVESFTASMQRSGSTASTCCWRTALPRADRYVDAWKALQALRDSAGQGDRRLQRPRQHLQTPLRRDRRVASTTVELHPYPHARSPSSTPRTACHRAWSPLASGKEVLDDPSSGHR